MVSVSVGVGMLLTKSLSNLQILVRQSIKVEREIIEMLPLDLDDSKLLAFRPDLEPQLLLVGSVAPRHLREAGKTR